MAGVSGVAEAATDFPVSRCARCSRDVLTHVDLEDDGTERRRCLHCDAEIDPEEVRWVAEPELVTLGYDVQGEAPVGCGRPGCGMGRCGNN